MNIRKNFDLSVYFVADSSVCAGRDVAQIVRMAVAGGATMVQLRNKSGDQEKFECEARAIQAVLLGSSIPFLINDDVDLAVKIGADGVHIGQEDMPSAHARSSIGETAILGLTAYTPEHFRDINTKIVDYVGVGAFYATLTKPDKPVLGAKGFAQLVKDSPVPVVGIGGITPDNAGAVIKAGAKGVAMMRGVSEAQNPTKAAQDFVQAVKRAK